MARVALAARVVALLAGEVQMGTMEWLEQPSWSWMPGRATPPARGSARYGSSCERHEPRRLSRAV